MIFTEEERREITKKKRQQQEVAEQLGINAYEMAEMESLYESLEDDKKFRDSFNIYNSMTSGLSIEYFYIKGQFPKIDKMIIFSCEEQEYQKYITQMDEDGVSESPNIYKVNKKIWDSPSLQDICQLKKTITFSERPSSKRNNIYSGVEIENPIWRTEPEREENFFYSTPDIPDNGIMMNWINIDLLDPSEKYTVLYEGKTFYNFIADNIINEIDYNLEERKEFAEEYIEFLNKLLNYLKYSRKIEMDEGVIFGGFWNEDHMTLDDIHPLYASTSDEQYNIRRELYRLSRSNFVVEAFVKRIKNFVEAFIAGGQTPIDDIHIPMLNRDVVIDNFMTSPNTGGFWVFSRRREKIIDRLHKERGSLRPFVRSRKNLQMLKERLEVEEELDSSVLFPLVFFDCMQDGDDIDRVIIHRIFKEEIEVGDIVFLTTDSEEVPEIMCEVEEVTRGELEEIGIKEGESLLNNETKIVDKFTTIRKRTTKIFLKNMVETSSGEKASINQDYVVSEKFRVIKEIANSSNFWGNKDISEQQIF